MKAAYDEIVAVKRQHEPQRIIGDLLVGELSDKQARSMRYQLTIAKLTFAQTGGQLQFHLISTRGSLMVVKSFSGAAR